MTLFQFNKLLNDNPEHLIRFVLPNEEAIPSHYHITEVGHVQKNFIDCGGTFRSSSTCVLQAWIANDDDHALKAGKLASILKLAHQILPSEELPVEVEFEAPFISQFPIATSETTSDTLVFQLEAKQTDCLAKEKCKVESNTESSSCCSPKSGCC